MKRYRRRDMNRPRKKKVVEPEAPPDPPQTRGRGRPSKYKPEYAHIAKKLCELGATDAELADAFDVEVSTIWYWQVRHPEFSSAIKAGKAPADERVERSLFQRAVGYTFDSEEIKVVSLGGRSGSEIERVPVKKHVPPDTTAQIFWLKNRRKALWRDVHKLEHTGEDGKPIEYRAAKETLARKIAQIGQRINGGDRGHKTEKTNGSGSNGSI